MKINLYTQNAERNFAKAVDRMARMPGFDRKKIVMAEAGSILKTCASKTKVAAAPKIQTGARLRALKGLQLTRGGDITINAGIRGPFGRVFMRKKSGSGYRRTHEENFQPINQHYTNAAWSKLSAVVQDAKNVIARVAVQARASAALARGSWVLIADSLGIRLESVQGGGSISASAIGKARDARARGGVQRNNGASRQESSVGRFFVTLINRLPYGGKLGFDGMLKGAVAGRAKFMEKSIEKGFTGSLQDTAKLFPGWVVKGGGN